MQSYPWEVVVFNVTRLVRGFHRSEFENRGRRGRGTTRTPSQKSTACRPTRSTITWPSSIGSFVEAKDKGDRLPQVHAGLQRTLRFENVAKEKAEAAFGKRQSQLTPEQIKEFEDFIMWRLCELSAKYEMPFQIHTGQARIQGSNPMNLVDLIEANPKTKFILFHGGFPVGRRNGRDRAEALEARVGRFGLAPELSYSTAKRAFHEWLDAFPSNRIMWGADCNNAEGIYGATEFHRRCIAEVLAEKVMAGDLIEEHALQIGRQIMRDNALELFPQLKERLWKHKGIKLTLSPVTKK